MTKFEKRIRDYFKNEDDRYVLIAEEKHGTHYMDATSFEMLCKNALGLLTQRYEEDFWYNIDDFNDEAPATPKATKFKDAALQRVHDFAWQQFERSLAEHKEAKNLFNEIKDAVDTKNGLKAYWCLLQRQGCQYETIQLEPLTILEDEDEND